MGGRPAALKLQQQGVTQIAAGFAVARTVHAQAPSVWTVPDEDLDLEDGGLWMTLSPMPR
jgi:hypothetical protein